MVTRIAVSLAIDKYRLDKKQTLRDILFPVLVGDFIIFSAVVWSNPELQPRLAFLEGEHRAMDLLVASIGAMFVGPSVALIAYFSDFLRGYYISLLMAVGVFLMIFLNQPVYLMVCAALIILPGVALFVRFLLTHPLPPAEARRG